MTESSPVTHFQPEEGVVPGSCGVPVPNTIAKVVDPDSGRCLGPNEVNAKNSGSFEFPIEEPFFTGRRAVRRRAPGHEGLLQERRGDRRDGRRRLAAHRRHRAVRRARAVFHRRQAEGAHQSEGAAGQVRGVCAVGLVVRPSVLPPDLLFLRWRPPNWKISSDAIRA